MLQHSLTQVRLAREPALSSDEVYDDSSAPGNALRVGIGKKGEARLADVPLIVEDLLRQARQLADLGARTETVKAILDHAAALREGCG